MRDENGDRSVESRPNGDTAEESYFINSRHVTAQVDFQFVISKLHVTCNMISNMQ